MSDVQRDRKLSATGQADANDRNGTDLALEWAGSAQSNLNVGRYNEQGSCRRRVAALPNQKRIIILLTSDELLEPFMVIGTKRT